MIKKVIVASLLFAVIFGCVGIFNYNKKADLPPPGGNIVVAELPPPGGNSPTTSI